MPSKKGGLGRGLDSLFAESAENTVSAPSVLRLSDIEPDKDQPRKHFAPEALQELADSIRSHGVLQPLLVRPKPLGGYQIVAGERRWRAARLAGLTEVPAVVQELDDTAAMEIALIENLQREDLDPIEEAAGYQQLIARCGYTQEAAAERLGKSRTAVTNSLRLLSLQPPVLAMVQDGRLSVGHAKVLLGLTGEAQCAAAEKVAADGLTVRQTEQLCKSIARPARVKTSAVLPPTLPGEVSAALQETLGTQVRVKYQDGRGTLQVDFYSDEQLREFAKLLGEYRQQK